MLGKGHSCMRSYNAGTDVGRYMQWSLLEQEAEGAEVEEVPLEAREVAEVPPHLADRAIVEERLGLLINLHPIRLVVFHQHIPCQAVPQFAVRLTVPGAEDK